MATVAIWARGIAAQASLHALATATNAGTHPEVRDTVMSTVPTGGRRRTTVHYYTPEEQASGKKHQATHGARLNFLASESRFIVTLAGVKRETAEGQRAPSARHFKARASTEEEYRGRASGPWHPWL